MVVTLLSVGVGHVLDGLAVVPLAHADESTPAH
jgi:hypothetical protein